MIRVEHVEVFNFEGAIRGLRNPLNSWDKSDSYICDDKHCGSCKQDPETRDCSKPDGHVIGKNDLDLMRRLYKAGTEHRKYLRQIFVSMDIVAPLYLLKELDTYKIGTTSNSCSTMHRLTSKEIELGDFSIDDYEMLGEWKDAFSSVIADCEKLRQAYIKTNDKRYWRMLIQLLPTSYNQRRTITMNYENVVTIIKQRTGHKLDEWNDFCAVLSSLPYIKEIMDGNEI